MPNRIIKESICTSENIDQLSSFQETVFYRLLVNCDDYGRMDARPKILAARLFPLKDIRAAQMEDALRALTSAELVTLYEVGGKPFLQMKTWERHQQIRAKKSKYPSADEGRCNHMISSDIKCPRNPIQSEYESKRMDDDDDDDDDSIARAREEVEMWDAVSMAIETQLGRKATPAEVEQVCLRARLARQTPEMAALAVRKAAANGARNMGKYVARIFDEWSYHEVRTPEEAEEHQMMYDESNGNVPWAVDPVESYTRMEEARERRRQEHGSGAAGA